MGTRSRIWMLVGAAVLAACGGPTPPPPPPGKVTASFTPRPLATPDATLTFARMTLRKVAVYGNVQPMGPPPNGVDVVFDVLAPAVTIELPNNTPGVYSRILFPVENITIKGTWRGTPFEARLAPFKGPLVDLRSPTGKELGPGQDITFAVAVDPNVWFATGLLDKAFVKDGRISIDGLNNSDLLMPLTTQVVRSFSLAP